MNDAREQEHAAAAEVLRKRLTETPAPQITTAIPIERIVIDPKFQIRNALDLSAVVAYQRRYSVGSYMPPIEVADVAGAFYLIDGYHRIEALRRLNRTDVQARIRELATIEEAMWLGGEINSGHGVKLTKEERYKRFVLYLKMGKHYVQGKPQTVRWVKSYRQIGEDFGIFHTTAEKLVKKADRRLWAALSERNSGIERSTGGLRVSQKIKPEDIVRRNLDNVRAGFAGITTPEARGEIIAKLEAVTAELKAGAQWTPFEDLEF
jgi:hypothetical protein